jgi:hypothetical protein
MAPGEMMSSHAVRLRSPLRALTLCGVTAAGAAAGGYASAHAGEPLAWTALLALVVLSSFFAGLATLWSP